MVVRSFWDWKSWAWETFKEGNKDWSITYLYSPKSIVYLWCLYTIFHGWRTLCVKGLLPLFIDEINLLCFDKECISSWMPVYFLFQMDVNLFADWMFGHLVPSNSGRLNSIILVLLFLCSPQACITKYLTFYHNQAVLWYIWVQDKHVS